MRDPIEYLATLINGVSTMRRIGVLLIGVSFLGVALPNHLPAAELQAGVAVVDITAPKGYRMSGYFHERLNTGTHDPLLAKALVLRQGDEQAALVFCDLIGLSRDVSSCARDLAAKKTGIPAANIVIAATHSHTGPLYMGGAATAFPRADSRGQGRGSAREDRLSRLPR